MDLPPGTETMTLADGRTLAWHAVGPADGPAMLHNHGGPSSRLEVALAADAAHRAGLRLIGIDRPGIGLSSPQPDRTLDGWADDVLALADHLGLDRFAVSGWSEGGPYALACAARLPAERLALTISVAGGSYGTFGTNWAAKHLNLADRLGGFLATHLKPGFKLMYDILAWDALEHSEGYWKQLMRSVSAYDRDIGARPGVKDGLLASTRACFRQGDAGLIADARLIYEHWPFDVRALPGPVAFWQGDDDRLVPRAINREVADAVPHAEWHEVPGGGHLIFLGEIDAILARARAALAPG